MVDSGWRQNTSYNNRKTKNTVSYFGKLSLLLLFSSRILGRETSIGQYTYHGKVVFGFFCDVQWL